MKLKSQYRKLAAFVPAIVCVVPFIAYRAGAFDRFTKPAPQPVATLFEDDPASATDPQSQVFMYSSKSAPAFTPAEPAPSEKPPTFMGGSKSKGLFVPATGSTTADQATPAVPTAPQP